MTMAEKDPPPRRDKKRGKSAKRKPRGRPFAPGNKAGKGFGRPKIPETYIDAMDVMEPMALQALGEIIADEKHPQRGKHAEYVINRRRGMPTQRSEITGRDGKPVEVTGAPEMMAALKKIAGEE